MPPPGKGNQPGILRQPSSWKIVTGRKSASLMIAIQLLKYSAFTSGRFFSS